MKRALDFLVRAAVLSVVSAPLAGAVLALRTQNSLRAEGDRAVMRPAPKGLNEVRRAYEEIDRLRPTWQI